MTIKEQISWCRLQIKAGHEVVAIRSILNRLQNLQGGPQATMETELYNQCLAVYSDFIAGRNLPFLMDARQGKALKEIIAKLQTASLDKNDTGALNSWTFILRNWQRTGDFIGRQIALSDINRNLLEILDKIRNGATKKQSSINEAERFHNQLTK